MFKSLDLLGINYLSFYLAMMCESSVLSLDMFLNSCMIIEPEHRIFVNLVEPMSRLQLMVFEYFLFCFP